MSAERVAAAIRSQETGGSPGGYGAQKVAGHKIKVGAYGIALDDWEAQAALMGVPGARWQDPRAQDYVVTGIIERLYDKYADWRLVTIAWHGGEEMADAVSLQPTLISHPKLAPVKNYGESVLRQTGLELDFDMGSLASGDRALEPQAQTSDAESVLRRRLIEMRDHVRVRETNEGEAGGETVETGETEEPVAKTVEAKPEVGGKRRLRKLRRPIETELIPPMVVGNEPMTRVEGPQ